MDRWAVVTGASGGIGLELARELARRGYALALSARSGAALEALADELRLAHDVRCLVCAVDLAAPGGADALARALAEAGVHPEILVNNAGIGVYGPFAEADADRVQAMLELNVVALTRLTRLLLPAMIDLGGARILNVASTAAFQPGPGMAAYFASKAYVLSLSEALAVELRRRGVTVTALCPGPTATGFVARAAGERAAMLRGGLADAGAVARAGVAGLLRGRRVVVSGWRNRMMVRAQRFAPRRLVTWLAAWMMREV